MPLHHHGRGGKEALAGAKVGRACLGRFKGLIYALNHGRVFGSGMISPRSVGMANEWTRICGQD